MSETTKSAPGLSYTVQDGSTHRHYAGFSTYRPGSRLIAVVVAPDVGVEVWSLGHKIAVAELERYYHEERNCNVTINVYTWESRANRYKTV